MLKGSAHNLLYLTMWFSRKENSEFTQIPSPTFVEIKIEANKFIIQIRLELIHLETALSNVSGLTIVPLLAIKYMLLPN